MSRLFLKMVVFDTAVPLLVHLRFPSLNFISHASGMREFESGNRIDRNLAGDFDQVSSRSGQVPTPAQSGAFVVT